MQKYATIWLQMKLTITEYSLTTSAQLDNKIREERTLYLVMRLCGETEHDTNDNVTTKIQTDFHTEHMKLYSWHDDVFCPCVCFVLFCLRQHIHELHTTSRGSSFTCARLVIPWWAYLFDHESSTLSPPFPFTPSSFHSSLTSCTSSCTPPPEGRSNLRTSPERRWDSLDDSWHMSSTTQSPWPHPQFSEPRFLDMWITMTPRSRRCFTKHTEYMSITPSEKACLSVSRRRPCPSERMDPLESEQGHPFWKEVRS